VNLTELSDVLAAATDVLRVETLDAYSTASDGDMLERYVRGDPKPDPSEKQPWLDRLAAAAAAGHPWKRLRVVTRPVPQYVRYACEFGYVDNVAAGEDVRILDESADHRGAFFRAEGDFYLIEGRALHMSYDDRGQFVSAWEENDSVSDGLAGSVWLTWPHAVPFTEWWAANPDLHRDQPAAV
jgi:hypothetical protein